MGPTFYTLIQQQQQQPTGFLFESRQACAFKNFINQPSVDQDTHPQSLTIDF